MLSQKDVNETGKGGGASNYSSRWLSRVSVYYTSRRMIIIQQGYHCVVYLFTSYYRLLIVLSTSSRSAVPPSIFPGTANPQGIFFFLVH